MTDDHRPLIRALYEIEPGVEVLVRVADGSEVVGRPSRIERDEAGIRIELCPHDADAPQYRLRAQRTPDGWQSPVAECRPLEGSWTRCGALLEATVLPADGTQ